MTINETIYKMSDGDLFATKNKIAKFNRKVGREAFRVELLARVVEKRLSSKWNYVSNSFDNIEVSVYVNHIKIHGHFKPDLETVLAARLEPMAGGNLIQAVPSEAENLPERFRTTGNCCEHCNTTRNRNEYFVVRSEKTGEYMQVGSSCLQKYLECSAAYMRSFVKLCDELDDEGKIGGGNFAVAGYWVKDVLAYALADVKERGYHKADSEQWSTAACVQYNVCKMKKDKRDPEYITPATDEEVEAMLDWLDRQNADNDYIHNLKLLSSQLYIDKGFPILVSLASAYLREFAKEAEEKQRNAERPPQIDLVEGRQTIEGVIVSRKAYANEYQYGGEDIIKVLVDCGTFKTFGGLAKAIRNAKVGDRVKFDAMIEPKETGFGYHSRPTKAEIVERASDAA